jgi:hypothetical protein
LLARGKISIVNSQQVLTLAKLAFEPDAFGDLKCRDEAAFDSCGFAGFTSSARHGVRTCDPYREYLEVRNRQMRAKAFISEVAAAVRRGELIEKRLVTAQAQYLFVAMRQKILNLPATYARHLVGLKDVREVNSVLEGAARSILNEIKDLPGTVTDPHWLESLEENVESGKTSD